MEKGVRFRRWSRPIQREAAEHYLLLGLIGFAASVSVTRFFLTVTGYPQIGGGELHIAHVFWGGLLLFAAALLPLIFINRWVYTASALLAGIGVGLFIDEVGKFITQRNDYFYPAAAPIIYVFFLLTVLLFLHLRRFGGSSEDAQFGRVWEAIRESLDHPMAEGERDDLMSRLRSIMRNASSARSAELARCLIEFVQGDTPATRPSQAIDRHGAIRVASRVIAACTTQKRFCRILTLGLLILGLLMLKNPASALLGDHLPAGLGVLLALHEGRQISSAAAPGWFEARVVLELGVGLLLLTSSGLIATGRQRLGLTVGLIALLLSLTTVNLFLFYFEQFSTIVTTALQFLLLSGLLYYGRLATRVPE